MRIWAHLPSFPTHDGAGGCYRTVSYLEGLCNGCVLVCPTHCMLLLLRGSLDAHRQSLLSGTAAKKWIVKKQLILIYPLQAHGLKWKGRFLWWGLSETLWIQQSNNKGNACSLLRKDLHKGAEAVALLQTLTGTLGQLHRCQKISSQKERYLSAVPCSFRRRMSLKPSSPAAKPFPETRGKVARNVWWGDSLWIGPCNPAC